jgi:hypothetical protein
MVGRRLDWKEELGRLAQAVSGSVGAATNLSALCIGLIGPANRKSIHPMAERLLLGEYDSIAPLHCRRRLGCGAGGDSTELFSG